MLDFSPEYPKKVKLYLAEKELQGTAPRLSWRAFHALKIPLVPYEFWNPYVYAFVVALMFSILYVGLHLLANAMLEIQIFPYNPLQAGVLFALAVFGVFILECVLLFFGFKNYPQKHSLGSWSKYA